MRSACFIKNRSLESRKNLNLMQDKFKKGQFLDLMDFEAAGFSEVSAKYAIRELKNEYGLDILSVCRGKAIVGWILADEIL